MEREKIARELVSIARELTGSKMSRSKSASSRVAGRNWTDSELEKMVLEIIRARNYRGVKTDKRIMKILDEDYGGAPNKRQYDKAIEALYENGDGWITKTKRGWK